MIHFDHELEDLKQKLLTMAAHAEQAVARAMKALADRDDALAGRIKEEDRVLDQFEMEIDDLSIQLLSKAPLGSQLRLITVAMKVSGEL
jgi:phosphate transport system protein